MNVILGGLQKTTLVDFPGRVACTVFTCGCNFRCGYCHNPELVNKSGNKLDIEEFFKFLKNRKEILDGVCVTGGEPTLHGDLVEFCGRIKKLGLEVKLDTNGTNPEMLRSLIGKRLIDMVAMDVKISWGKYGMIGAGEKMVDGVRDSLFEILSSGIEYELRTTVVPIMHSVSVLEKMARQIGEVAEKAGVNLGKVVWFWQEFKAGHCLDKKFNEVGKFGKNEAREMLMGARRVLSGTKWR